MVSSVAATSTVSATLRTLPPIDEIEKPSLRHYDVAWQQTGEVVGKLTIDLETSHWIFNANYAKSDTKDMTKGWVGHGHVHASVPNDDLWWDGITMTKGGTAHGEGVIGSAVEWFRNAEANHLSPTIVGWYTD